MTHVAWSCDGKRLAAVGIDKATRLWAPEISVSLCMFHYVRLATHVAPRWSTGPRLISPAVILTMQTTYRGIQLTPSFSVHPVRRTGESFSGTFDVSTSTHVNSGIDNLLQESRHVQQIQLKVSPVQTNYAPDGKSLLYTSAGHQLFFLTYGKDNESSKDVWQISDKDAVSVGTISKVSSFDDVIARPSLRPLPCSTMSEMGLS